MRDHFHATDPETPPRSDDTASQRNGGAELNFDLAELGLEDSMIKPGQLTKLEKIGSGGFKEYVLFLIGGYGGTDGISVYLGKLRGRKVAISEFRGHLSESKSRIELSNES